MREGRWEISTGAALLFPLLYYLDSSGWFAAALPGILLHEGAHALAIRLSGGKLLSARLEVTGLCLEKTPLDSDKKELCCALAGPAAGLLWALFCLVLPGEYAKRSALTSFLIHGFNLLPALPLDGGQALLHMTNRPALLRWSGAASAAACIVFGIHYRLYGLFLPAVLLMKYVFIP